MRLNIQMQFNDYIAARGLKLSRQRMAVLDAFLSSETDLSADELFLKLRAGHPRIGRATVFRTMKLLAESGIATVVAVQKSPVLYAKQHYRPDMGPTPKT